MNNKVLAGLTIQPRLQEFDILKNLGLRVNKESTRFQEHVFTVVVKCLNQYFFIN
jgi:hypothetical protein